MTKLAPSPLKPVDLVPAEQRRESLVLPDITPLQRTGPVTHRDDERRAIMAALTREGSGSTTPNNQTPAASKVNAPSPTPQQHTPSPALASAPDEKTTNLSTTPTGFFALLQEKFFQLTGIGGTLKNSVPGGEKHGPLEHLSSLIKECAASFIHRTRSWLRPAPRTTTPQSLNIKLPSTIPAAAQHQAPSETVIIEPRKGALLEFDTETKGDKSITEKALTTLASAKQTQLEEREKKESKEQEIRRHDKEGAEAALRKLQLDGLNPSELAQISAELHGVYGTAETALRNANDLVKRKKGS